MENRELLATLYWQGDVSNSWNNVNNWTTNPAVDTAPAVAPATGDTLNFATSVVNFNTGAAQGYTPNNDIPGLSNLTLSIVDGGASDFTLSGLVAGLSAAGISNNTTTGTGATISMPVDVAASAIDVVAGNLSLTGVVSGTSLTKSNAGTLTLSGQNTFTGGTTVNGGTLSLRAAAVGAVNVNPLGTGPLNVNNMGNVVVSQASQPLVGMPNALAMSWFNSASTAMITDIGNNTATGGLLGATQQGAKLVTSALNFGNDAAFQGSTAGPLTGSVLTAGDNYMFLYRGYFTPAVSGTYQFGLGNQVGAVHIDDEAAIYLDTSGNGLFDTAGGERVAYVASAGVSNAGAAVNLTAGVAYPMAIAYREATGGAMLIANVQRTSAPAVAWANINAGTGSGVGTFSAYGTPAGAAFGSNPVNVSGAVSIETQIANFGFASLNAAAGSTLTLNGTGTGVNGTVSFGSAVLAGAATITTNTAHGNIAGVLSQTVADTFTKNGGNILTLAGTNTYAGTTAITGGTLRVANPNALGTIVGGTTISGGGTLDIHGVRVGPDGNEPISVEGTGVSNNGAIVNTRGASQLAVIRNLTLTNNATLSSNARWDIRDDGTDPVTFDMNGFTLTKVGSAELCIVNGVIVDPGSVNVTANIFRIEGTTEFDGTGTITVSNGATLDVYGNNRDHSVNINLGSSTFSASGGGTSIWSGTITLGGNASVITNNTSGNLSNFTINGQITGAGSITKSGSEVLTLNNNTNNYAGSTAINAGTVVVSAANGLGAATAGTGGTSVAAGATLRFNAAGPITSAEPLLLNGNGVANAGALQIATSDVTLSGSVGLVGDASISSNTAGRLLTINGEVNNTIDSDLTLMGAGNFDINGNITDKGYSLSPITARVFINATQPSLTSETVVTNFINGTTAPNGTATLNGPLQLTNLAAFNALFTPTALTENFNSVFETTLTVTVAGTYTFAATNNDDNAMVWLKPSANAAFAAGDKLYAAAIGNNNTAVATRFLTPGTYTLVYVHRENTGLEAFTGRIGSPGNLGVTDGNTLPIVNPTVTGTSHFIKTGAGNVNLSGNNTYNGVTLVHQGTLTVDSNNALGAPAPISSDFTIGPMSQHWQLGIDNGTNTDFSQENGASNPAPGSATARDDDYYFAGTYPAPIGTLAVDEITNGAPATGFERALTQGDPNDRIHFNLGAAELDDTFQLQIDIYSADFTGGSIPFQVLVNGVQVHAATISAVGVVTTATFTGASVNMTSGDNVVTLTRTTGVGTGAYIQFDYIRLSRQAQVYNASNTQLEPGTSLTITGGITTPESLVLKGVTGVFAPTGANSVTGTVNMLTNTTYDVSAAASLSLTNSVQGPANLTKVGSGAMTLAGINSYTGTTNVNAGSLTLQNGAAISDTAGAVSVALGATLQLLNNETVSSYVGAGDGVGSNDSLLALGGNTLTTTGSAAIANVTTAVGGGIIAGTSITDNDDDNNVTGPNVYLQAGTGIGTVANAIETAVSSIQLNNTTSGDINILNSNAGALLTVANLRPLGFGSQNLGGSTTIVNSSPLTIAANVISAVAVVLTASDSAAVGDNLTVDPGVIIQSTGSTVTLNAGDNATVPATSLLAAAGTVTINIDAGNADPGVGGSLQFDGDVDAPLAVFNGLGDTNGDSFDVRPDQDVGDVLTPIRVFGFAPTAGAYPVGDRLTVDINGLGTPTLTLGPGARNGSFSFGALAASLTYNDIETVESDPLGATFHVVLDMRYSGFENGADDTILAQLNAAGTMLQLLVNAAPVFEGADDDIASLTIIGSNDNEGLTVQETAGGLPKFAGAAPAVDNIGIGGGTSNGSHLGSSADLALETLLATSTPWNAADVTFHFDAGAGSDSLTVNYTTPNSSGYFSDTNDAGNSGNVLAAPGAFPLLSAPTLLMSFANIEPLALNGAGGLLLTDATGTSAATSLTLTDVGPATQIAGNNGFATTSFTGYQSAVIVGGDGAETLDVVSVDAATLTDLTLLGGNTNDLFSLPGGDASADTLRIQSLPAAVAATLNGNAGSDLFQLFDGLNSVDNIAGNVTIDGNDGNVGGNTDTLTIVNTGGGSADAAVIAAVNAGASQDYYVDGVTTAVSEDVIFRNIDVLNYTGTTFDDSIDARLQNTTPTQHDLSTLNLSGWTGADQFLLFTSDQLGGSGLNNTPSATASGVANVNLYGDAFGNPNGLDGNDTFGATPAGISGTGATNVGLLVSDSTRMIRPSASTAIAIDGGQPTGLAAPLGDVIGDVLNVDVSALPNSAPVIVSTFSPGTVVAAGIQPLTWTQIEDLNLVDQGRLTNVQMGDLFARSTPNADLIQLTRNPTALNPNQVRLRITSSIGNYSVSNKTIMYGGGANDTLTQSNLTIPAEFYGEAGDDYLTGAMNNDWLVGGDGNDRINGSGGDNVIWGDNSPTSADPIPQNAATGGDDQLSGLGGNDVFYGSGGNDLVSGGAGSDYANGGFGNDTLDGNDGDDLLYGGDGNDVISGHTGNDLLSGGDGEDRLYGAAGNDVLLAGDGADSIEGGDGNDLLINGIVANETSTWTSVASTATYSAATYTNAGDNDAALLILLNQWGAASDPSFIGAITHDGDNDDLFGGTGDDDFCWETIDVQPALTPADYNAIGMGTDQRIPPL